MGHNMRRLHAVYWSSAHFGMAALAHESYRLCLAVVRSDVVADLDGGLSYVFRALLQTLFSEQRSTLQRRGIRETVVCVGVCVVCVCGGGRGGGGSAGGWWAHCTGFGRVGLHAGRVHDVNLACGVMFGYSGSTIS